MCIRDRYIQYEKQAAQGKLKNTKTIKAVDLWRKMLSMLFETGHPWLTFKDSCNLRSPQGHEGVIHSSNLCTEITLNTSENEIAVCNLGSINLTNHLNDDLSIDESKLRNTIYTAVRMLDNVVDNNFYPLEKAKNSNMRHRPIGLGQMGFQDLLYTLNLPYASEEAVKLADETSELISYYAISASVDLASERGAYRSFEGSHWSKGMVPVDSIANLANARDENHLKIDNNTTLDWDLLRSKVKGGIRNSNIMAIAPTATISNISGVSQSIEPTYQNLYVKSNLSGEFTFINEHLVTELKKRNLWDDSMINDLKDSDGSVQKNPRIPNDIKEVYKTAFEIEPQWLVMSAAKRQKWIDQGQSLNLYMSDPSGSKLDSLYKLAWVMGLKTTYYLRSIGATHVEKNTDKNISKSNQSPQACSIMDPECEACQ